MRTTGKSEAPISIMTEKPSPSAIRQASADNPKMREREHATQLGISEAEFVAAWCGGHGATRIDVRISDVLTGLKDVGEVLALTRNESAVHEKVGVYENPAVYEKASIVLGPDIDLRIFQDRWVHGFAVEKGAGEELRRSLQFFDAAGEAVHKVHLRPASVLEAYEALVASLRSGDQQPSLAVVAPASDEAKPGKCASVEELRNSWSRMTDVHQFHGMLRDLNVERQQAIRMVGEDYAWQLDNASLTTLLEKAAGQAVPIMCFVGNKGCIQIHSGPVGKIAPFGPWINVLDEGFHLHVRTDHLAELWAVRKPVKEGHVTSIEAYDAKGELFISFFGKRHEGEDERGDWRSLAEDLPRRAMSSAA